MVNPPRTLNSRFMKAWSAAILLLLYLPVGLLILNGFNAGNYALKWEGFSLRWYAISLSNIDLINAMLNSFIIAALSTVFAVTIGFLYALWAHRTQLSRLVRATDSLITLPLFIPEIVIAIGLLITIIRFIRPTAGAIGLPFDSLSSVIIGHTTLALGYAALILRTRFKNYDLQQELAARDLGARRWNIFKSIMLPQILPGIAAAASIAFAISLDDFYVSYFLSTGGSSLKTLPLYIWSLQGRRAMTPEINVVSSILLLIAIFFFGLGMYLTRSGEAPGKKG